MSLTFTILGCGNSSGTPSIGNHWGACDSAEPKNRRTRPAAYIQSAKTRLLIDAGPDLKEQANREGITDLDAVLYTHGHADHILGTEELRVFRLRHKKFVPIFADRPTMADLRMRFDYLFFEGHEVYPEVLKPSIIEPDQFNQPMTIGDIEFIPFEQDHGTCKSIGIRLGSLAYSTDMKDLDQQALETLRGVKTWVVDAAAYKMESNPVHATLKKVFELNEIVQAQDVVLFHMPSYMDFKTMCDELPKGYRPAYDGMKFEIA